MGWFTIEYLLRLFASPNKSKFVRSVSNNIDLVVLLPFYASLVIDTFYADNTKDFTSIRKAMEIFRVLRIMRILKLARHSSGLQTLGYTLQRSYKELSMLLMFLMIFILIFSSAAFYAEKEANAAQFRSIPHAFWWAIVVCITNDRSTHDLCHFIIDNDDCWLW
jgi:potassium voltage-gated channel Shab-related subfamily B member 1